MINWEDVLSGARPTARRQITYQLASCLRWSNTPEGTYHRYPDAERAGLHPLTHCPRCGPTGSSAAALTCNLLYPHDPSS
jgi:hypothetical protein